MKMVGVSECVQVKIKYGLGKQVRDAANFSNINRILSFGELIIRDLNVEYFS